MLEVAGTRTVPPFEPLAYKAAEACGRLPLVLAVAGGILADAGGRLSEDFLRLIHEDHGEVLRANFSSYLATRRSRGLNRERVGATPD